MNNDRPPACKSHSYSSHPFLCTLLGGDYTGVLFCALCTIPSHEGPGPNLRIPAMIQTGRIHNQVHVIATSQPVNTKVPKVSLQASRDSMHSSHSAFWLKQLGMYTVLSRSVYQLLNKASHLTTFYARDSNPLLPVTPAQLMINWGLVLAETHPAQ